jgi:hypothetical protein
MEAVGFQRFADCHVQIGRAAGHRVDDDHVNAALEVTDTIGSKREPAARSILIRWAYQLDGRTELGAAQVLKDVNFDAL